MKLTANQMLHIAACAREKAMIAQAGLRAIQFQGMPKESVAILRSYTARKSAQCYRFEERLLEYIKALESEVVALREAADDEPSLAQKIEWAADARMYKA